MICVSLQESSITDLEKQIFPNLAYTSLFEFRLTENTLSLLPWILRSERPYRAIITLRTSNIISEKTRVSILQKALQDGADWIDWDQPSVFPTPFPSRVIYSYHDWEKTPSLLDIEQRYQERKHPKSWIKLVFHANSFLDNITIRQFLKKVQDPQVIAFCMGTQGQISRILAPCWGSAWTYAAPCSEKQTAPGQLTAEDLMNTYSLSLWKKEPSAYFGILGNPVQQSLSPIVHNRAFREKNISALYLPVETHDPSSVLTSDFFQGLSVTMPFKEQLCEFQDIFSFSSEVLRWKSVNTLLRDKNRWRAENTDAPAGCSVVGDSFFLGEQKRVVIWGSGGVARSLALAFAEKGCAILIQSRNENKGQALARSCQGRYLAWNVPIKDSIDLLIQGTPVGMTPETEKIPASLELFCGGLKALMETIYRPSTTLLMQQAKEKKIPVFSGLDFFMRQAHLQQILWTGTV